MKSHKRQKGWHAVTEQQQQGPRSGPGAANPSYVRPGRTSAADLSPEAFPGLGPGTSPATPTGQQPASKVPQLAQSPLRAGPPPPAQGSAWQGPPTKAAKSPLPRHQANAQSPAHHLTVTGDAVMQLVEVHPWAEPDLVEAVLLAANGDVVAAEQLLAELEGYKTGSESDEDIAQIALDLAGGEAGQKAGGSRKRVQPRKPSSGALQAPGGQSEGEAADVYQQHRHEALRLSRQWQKLMRRAGTAYAAEHHSEARRLAAEAHALRSQALQAHDAAAQQILRSNNEERGLGLLQLDLHGLHAAEAAQALEHRLVMIASKPHDRLELRIIVGRGNNSSGGEASLPRVIESFLLGRHLQFFSGRGFITVQLPALHCR